MERISAFDSQTRLHSSSGSSRTVCRRTSKTFSRSNFPFNRFSWPECSAFFLISVAALSRPLSLPLPLESANFFIAEQNVTMVNTHLKPFFLVRLLARRSQCFPFDAGAFWVSILPSLSTKSFSDSFSSLHVGEGTQYGAEQLISTEKSAAFRDLNSM